MLRKLMILPLLILALGIAVAHLWPTGSATSAPTYTPAYTAPSLPTCTHEDGSGQALCMWDASEQGNGLGTDAIAGDCSVATVGDADTSAACMRLWVQPAITMTLSDGATSELMNGSVLVSDCLDIEYEAEQDNAIREALNDEGWNLQECFKAHMQ